MKKIAIIGMICMFFAAGTTSLFAQQGRKGRNMQKSTLSEEQKEQMKEVRIKHASETKDLRNELNELQARQKTLVSANQPNKKEVYANIDKMSSIKKELNLTRIDMRLEMRSFLDEEQLLRVGNRSGFKHEMKKGKHGQKGMRQGRGNGKRHAANCNKQFCDGTGVGAKGKGANMHNRNLLDLSDDQKEQMKDLRIAHMKDTESLRDEAELIRLKQKQMMTSENPSMSDLKTNVNRLSEIQNQLAKKRFDNQLEIRKILDEDQLVLFLNRSGKGFKHGRRAL